MTIRLARWVAVALTLCLPAAVSAGGNTPFDLARLTQAFATIKSAKVHFVEVRHLAIVAAPLTSSGVLSYEAPDRLERDTREPITEHYIAQGDRLTYERKFEGKLTRREFKLNDFATLRPFIIAVRATLAGDLATLEGLFTATLEGNADDWQLILRPKKQALGSSVREIRLYGRMTGIRRIETSEASGDSSRMTLTPIEPAGPPSPPGAS